MGPSFLKLRKESFIMKFNKSLVYPLLMQLIAFILIVVFNYIILDAHTFARVISIMIATYIISLIIIFALINFNKKRENKLMKK